MCLDEDAYGTKVSLVRIVESGKRPTREIAKV